MMKNLSCLILGLVFALPSGPAAAETPKYTLRYRFEPGQTLRWEVVSRRTVRTTVNRTTQNVETYSKSVKVWEVKRVEPDGSAVFEHRVDDVEMWQKLGTKPEVRYDSRTDEEPPMGFQHLAEAVGVPLSTVTLSPRGEVLKRDRKPVKAAALNKGQITLVLPEDPVAVGESWSKTYPVQVRLNNGMVKRVKTLQTMRLKRVKTSVATVEVSTQVLTPISNPALEAKLIERERKGRVKFDLDAGRVIGQRMDLDKRVVGFRGPASSIHYTTRFTEELLRGAPRVADRPGKEKVER